VPSELLGRVCRSPKENEKIQCSFVLEPEVNSATPNPGDDAVDADLEDDV
jgi:hypothetical protein